AAAARRGLRGPRPRPAEPAGRRAPLVAAAAAPPMAAAAARGSAAAAPPEGSAAPLGCGKNLFISDGPAPVPATGAPSCARAVRVPQGADPSGAHADRGVVASAVATASASDAGPQASAPPGPSTQLAEQLRVRRAVLFAKSERRELDVNDIAEHSKFISGDTVKQMQAQRRDIQRRHTLAHARLRREKRDVGRICSLMSQAERLEGQAEEFNANVFALNAEREWLHETDAWKGAVRELHEKYVQTASGEVIAKATLEQDEEECASFEEMLEKMKADAAEPHPEDDAALSEGDLEPAVGSAAGSPVGDKSGGKGAGKKRNRNRQ
ncbi:unnamed protein product, partial [Prorocentrum cordatum]